MKKLLIAAAAALMAATPASAGSVTRTYSSVASFSSGPYPTVTTTFTLTYDPMATAYGLVPMSLTSNNPAFTVPAQFNVMTYGTAANVTLGGVLNGVTSIVDGTADFFLNFSVTADGLVTTGNYAVYSQPGSTISYGTGANVVTVVPNPVTGAVPEPGIWAMIVLGFGLIGAALRRTVLASERRFQQRIDAIAAGEIA